MMTSNRPYLIRALHEWICDNGLTPQLLVDTTIEGVEVPNHVIKDDQVVLNVSPSATRGLQIGNQWLSFAARFAGISHEVSLPVAAVRAIFARETGWRMLLPEEEQPEQPQPTPPKDTSGSHLKVVK